MVHLHCELNLVSFASLVSVYNNELATGDLVTR